MWCILIILAPEKNAVFTSFALRVEIQQICSHLNCQTNSQIQECGEPSAPSGPADEVSNLLTCAWNCHKQAPNKTAYLTEASSWNLEYVRCCFCWEMIRSATISNHFRDRGTPSFHSNRPPPFSKPSIGRCCMQLRSTDR